MSYECIFCYLYTEVYNYGDVTDVINPADDEYARYTLAASLVFPNQKQMEELFSKLSFSLEYVIGFVTTSGILYDEEASQMLSKK